MDTGKAICLGSVLIALAIVAPEITKLKENRRVYELGTYMGAGAGDGRVWVVNTQTGNVRQCFRGDESALCGGWSR